MVFGQDWSTVYWIAGGVAVLAFLFAATDRTPVSSAYNVEMSDEAALLLVAQVSSAPALSRSGRACPSVARTTGVAPYAKWFKYNPALEGSWSFASV